MDCDEDLGKTLLRVGQELTKDDIKDMLYLLEDIPRSKKERILDGTELLVELKARNIVGTNHLEKLKGILGEIGRRDLVQKLVEFEQKVKSFTKAKAEVCLAGVYNFIETEQCMEVYELLKRKRLVMLRGISGSGKTQLSLWCANRFRRNMESQLVWRLNCQDMNDLMQSLRSLLNYFEMNFESQKDSKDTYILEMANVIKQRLESDDWQKRPSLFIFDNICEACENVVLDIFNALRDTSNVKILGSTESSTFCLQFIRDGEEVRHVKGVTKEEVWNFFKGSDHFEKCKDELDLLAKCVDYLPYALVLARLYIEATSMTVKDYITQLKSRRDFLETIEKRIRFSNYDKGLVGAQVLTLEKIEAKVSDTGKVLLQCMAFLNHEKVPYTLLKNLAYVFFPSAGPGEDIRELIHQMKSYSIGEITGTGDESTISLHAVTKLVIYHRLREEEHMRILKRLLWFFGCHLSIDCRLRSSLNSNLRLQCHAECVLAEAKEKMVCDPDMLMLGCIIHTAIGVSLRVSGTEHVLADEYLKKAREQMFTLIKEPPGSFRLCLDEQESNRQSDDTVPTESNVWWRITRFLSLDGTTEETNKNENSNDSKIKRLYAKLVDATKDLPRQFFADFLMKMNRSERDIKHLKEVAGVEYSDDKDISKNCLTPTLYAKLQSVKAAMPKEQIREIFGVELMIIILYNNGRHYYQWKQGDKHSDEFCCNEFLTAALLGKLLERTFPDFPSVQYLISQRNGIYYHHETDKRSKHGKDLDVTRRDLEDTIRRLEEMPRKTLKYFEFGILKVSEHYCLHQEAMTLNIILKCLIQLHSLCKEENVKLEYYNRAENYAKTLLQITEDMQDWNAAPGFHVQLARFYMMKKPPAQLQKAVTHFQKADDLEKQYNVKGLSHFKLQARFGLVISQKRLGDPTSLAKAQKTCQRLVDRLRKTKLHKHDGKKGKAEKLLEEIRQLIESSLNK
ncbi:LOW QUALITY PROTEIN: uncharacterized protein [Argopecten irradians]|uniref:LOW QUALITY PROTEIN: uncharacterized protein n=1 Tax=Argopecten irradians TaxID=31199 RepID=UPI00371E7F6C